MGKGKKSGSGSSHRKSSHKSKSGNVEAGSADSPQAMTDVMAKIPQPAMMIICGIQLIMGIVYIIMGSVNVQNCNIQPMIPIWLILMGVALVLNGLHEYFHYMRARKNKGRGVIALIVTGVLVLLTVAFFITGNVFVYEAWGVNPDYGHPWFSNGCNQSVYLLSFVSIIIMDALFGLAVIGILFFAVFQCFGSK